MWSRNGTGIKYPPDSGMPIGGSSSGITLLVLQVQMLLLTLVNNSLNPELGPINKNSQIC
jgi:hypothetical protein